MQALAMSMQVDQDAPSTAAAATPASTTAPTATPAAPGPAAAPEADMLEDVEDEELRMALALSMQDAGPGQVRTMMSLPQPARGVCESACKQSGGAEMCSLKSAGLEAGERGVLGRNGGGGGGQPNTGCCWQSKLC